MTKNKKGLLIYNQIDYDKNKWFVHELLTTAPQFGLDLSLVLREELILTIEEGKFIALQHKSKSDLSLNTDLSPIHVEFVINRTRDSIVATHFEKMGCKVFNNSEVTELCNHKGKTHQLVNCAGIPSVKTLLGNIHHFNPSHLPFDYPVILKSVSGHGGDEVYKLQNKAELIEALNSLRTEDFVLQELCTNPGIDVRVFALGSKILGAVKRISTSSFKSNYSLGGSAIAYALTTEEEAIVHKILSLADFNFVGIDFIFNKEGQFLFNEIEDVVGTRTLYLNYDINVVALFLEHIATTLNEKER